MVRFLSLLLWIFLMSIHSYLLLLTSPQDASGALSNAPFVSIIVPWGEISDNSSLWMDFSCKFAQEKPLSCTCMIMKLLNISNTLNISNVFFCHCGMCIKWVNKLLFLTSVNGLICLLRVLRLGASLYKEVCNGEKNNLGHYSNNYCVLTVACNLCDFLIFFYFVTLITS
jgi:hypothetical protein